MLHALASTLEAALDATLRAKERWPLDEQQKQGMWRVESATSIASSVEEDTALSDQLASLALAGSAAAEEVEVVAPAPAKPSSRAAVGDTVHFKRQDRSVIKGVVTRTETEGEAEFFWIRGADGEEYEHWPSGSVKRVGASSSASSSSSASASTSAVPSSAAATSSSDDAPREKLAFKLGKASKSSRAPAKQVAPAPPRAAAARPPSPPRQPRMPRIIAVVDTNELMPQSTGADRTFQPLERAHLLQGLQSRGCDVLLPTQVLDELDGLKRSDDAALAAAARRANALLADAASGREPWLLFEDDRGLTRMSDPGGWASAPPGAAAAALAPDERIVGCAAAFAASRAAEHPHDRVVVATRDRNAIVRAAAAGLEAMPLEQLRREAEERDRAWCAAYCQNAASSALERARLTTGAGAAAPPAPVTGAAAGAGMLSSTRQAVKVQSDRVIETW